MFGLSKTARFFCTFFLALTLVALGNDLYIMHKDGTAFYFAAIGGILKNYAPEQFKAMTAYMGMDNFNLFLGPILAQAATLVSLGLLAFSFATGFVLAHYGPASFRTKGEKEFSKAKKGEFIGYKDRVKYKRQ